jgi:hypothetical protein
MCASKLLTKTAPGNTPAGIPTAPAAGAPPDSPAQFDGVRGVHRHPIGSELEVRLWADRDERGCYVELRLFRRPVSELSNDASAFQRTDAGLRIPAHHAVTLGAQLQGLGVWADELAKREANR